MVLHGIDKRFYLVEVALRMDLVVCEDGCEIVAGVEVFDVLFPWTNLFRWEPENGGGNGFVT